MCRATAHTALTVRWGSWDVSQPQWLAFTLTAKRLALTLTLTLTRTLTLTLTGPIAAWDVSHVTDMSQLFDKDVVPAASEFNGNISKWDVSRKP